MQLKHFLLFFCFLVNMQSSVAQELPISYPYQTPTLIISSITFLAVGFGLGISFMHCINNKKIDTMNADIKTKNLELKKLQEDITQLKQHHEEQEDGIKGIVPKLKQIHNYVSLYQKKIAEHKLVIQILFKMLGKNNCTVCLPLITQRNTVSRPKM